jgi:hypothetical protein
MPVVIKSVKVVDREQFFTRSPTARIKLVHPGRRLEESQ